MDLCGARFIALLAVPLLATACIGAELDDDAEALLEGDEDALFSENGNLPNALNLNALNLNALNLNALNLNALNLNSLAPGALAAIQDPGANGGLSRELLRYVVSCALRPDQTFSFSWTDSNGVVRQEAYRGDLGMAPWWANGGISNDGYVQRQITGCLAARTNWYGVSVKVSLRNAEGVMTSDRTERDTYSVREGAFWGNLFTSTPYVRACYSPDGVARARQLNRDCAAGHLSVDPVTGATTVQQCGPIQILGSCDTLCNSVNPDGDFYQHCLDNPSASPWVRTNVVVTSFLPPASP